MEILVQNRKIRLADSSHSSLKHIKTCVYHSETSVKYWKLLTCTGDTCCAEASERVPTLIHQVFRASAYRPCICYQGLYRLRPMTSVTRPEALYHS